MKSARLLYSLVLSLSLLLSGCWNMREIEHLIYVNSIGVDYVDNKVVMYAQIISFSNIAKAEAGGQRQPQTIAIGKGIGDTFDTAIFQLYPSVTQRLSWGHIKSVVFTERAISHGLVHEVLDQFDRYYEFRYRLWAFATKESIEQIFLAKPMMNISVFYSQLTDPKEIYKQNSLIRPLYLYRFVSQRDEKNRAVLLPYLTITKDNWSENKKPLSELEIGGVCVTQNKIHKGCFSRQKVQGLRWLEKETVRSALPLKKNKKTISLLVLEKPKAQITTELKNDNPRFKVKVSLKGYVTERSLRIPVSEMEQLASNQIKEQILDTFQAGLPQQIDFLQLGHTLYRKSPHIWKKLAVNNTLPLSRESLSSVDVQVKLVHGGISKVK